MKLIIDTEVIKDHIETEWGYEGIRDDLDEIFDKHGTPLPKGHGRILDEKDILDTENNNGGWYDLVDMPEYIAGVKTIIEADKAESEVSE